MELYALVSASNNSSPASASTPPHIRPPMRPLQPVPPPIPSQPLSVPPDFLFPMPMSPQGEVHPAQPSDQMSIVSTNTSSTASSQSIYSRFDDAFSNSRLSIATTNSSLSEFSQFSVPIRSQPQPQLQWRPMRPPKHDPQAGLWNGILRVIPCGKYHNASRWDVFFPSCVVCGFTQWHALMLHARSMTIGSFVAAMVQLRDIGKVDFAGNYPMHFLLSAGVGMDYFSNLLQFSDNCGQNVFGQNPLHVLNPQDIGEQLVSFLEWFKNREFPPGLLMTQRDITCRTPLHNLLQHPFDRVLYQRIVKVFPFPEHQLLSVDTSSRTAIMLMNMASYEVQPESPSDFAKIQAGITEIKVYLSGAENSQNGNAQRYGFHDIARGARGTSYFGFYQCLICNQINTHSNSYLDQMVCACKHNRDRNAPDDTGMTPAHALITQARCNNDDEQTPETPAQTAELFRVLIPQNDPTLREALHVLDPQGNSLIYNIATRGFVEILEYALALEDAGRRPAMVNACSKKPNGGEWSVLDAVQHKYSKAAIDYNLAPGTKDLATKRELYKKAARMKNCRDILVKTGAVMKPSVTTRWKISG
jgi:hypothetical protein